MGTWWRLIWEVMFCLIYDGVVVVIMNSDCFVFDIVIVYFFVDNGNFGINVIIFICCL